MRGSLALVALLHGNAQKFGGYGEDSALFCRKKLWMKMNSWWVVEVDTCSRQLQMATQELVDEKVTFS